MAERETEDGLLRYPLPALSGIDYPSVGGRWGADEPTWKTISLFNPVVYLVSGFRWSFYGASDVGVGTSLAVTAGFMVACMAVLWWIFRTGWRLKP